MPPDLPLTLISDQAVVSRASWYVGGGCLVATSSALAITGSMIAFKLAERLG